MSVTDQHGDDTLSPTSGASTDCSSQQDAWVRTRPVNVTFTIKADFNKDVGQWTAYVAKSYIGVVGAEIEVVKVDIDGRCTE